MNWCVHATSRASTRSWLTTPSSIRLVYAPQVGKTITQQYLSAAFLVFVNDSFRYVRELSGPRDAVLEFQVEIDGTRVNGVDMLRWDDEGRIVEFKVMIRPLKAINLIQQKMAAMLQTNR